MTANKTDSVDKRIQKGEKTRNSILQAAIKLFFEKGFDGTSVKDITDAAGVPKSLFYHYYNSMDELFLSIINSSDIRMSSEEKNQYNPDGNANDSIGIVVDRIYKEMRENKVNLKIILMEALKNKTVFHLFLEKLNEIGGDFDLIMPKELKQRYDSKEWAVLRLYFRILPVILLVLTEQDAAEYYGITQEKIKDLLMSQME